MDTKHALTATETAGLNLRVGTCRTVHSARSATLSLNAAPTGRSRALQQTSVGSGERNQVDDPAVESMREERRRESCGRHVMSRCIGDHSHATGMFAPMCCQLILPANHSRKVPDAAADATEMQFWPFFMWSPGSSRRPMLFQVRKILPWALAVYLLRTSMVGRELS
jgi:hypothetical protein